MIRPLRWLCSERAAAVITIEKDALDGPFPIEFLARVTARMGDPDRAIVALQKLLSIPYDGALASGVPLTPALLRLDPMFDPLRMIRDFEKLAAPGAEQCEVRNDVNAKSYVSKGPIARLGDPGVNNILTTRSSNLRQSATYTLL